MFRLQAHLKSGERNRGTERQTDRQTETERQRETKTDRDTETEERREGAEIEGSNQNCSSLPYITCIIDPGVVRGPHPVEGLGLEVARHLVHVVQLVHLPQVAARRQALSAGTEPGHRAGVSLNAFVSDAKLALRPLAPEAVAVYGAVACPGQREDERRFGRNKKKTHTYERTHTYTHARTHIYI